MSLLTKKEIADREAKLEANDNKRDDGIEWRKRYEEADNIRKSYQLIIVRRAQERAEEYLNALILLVGSRGTSFVEFDNAFSPDDPEAYKRALDKYNTPEARRNLHTMLKSFTEIPKSWGPSATIRFWRGNGKQKESKYYGAGMFGVNYGWKQAEVDFIGKILTDRSEYAEVLMSYADVAEEIHEADPDFEIVDYGTQFAAIRVERDTTFINKLLKLLEDKGLGAIPVPTPPKPKKERKVKVFKSGDRISEKTLRDLPLPAHVKIRIWKYEDTDKERKNKIITDLDAIVTAMNNSGYFSLALIKPGTKNAYPFRNYERKQNLIGASFIGKWTGSIAKEKKIRVNFWWGYEKE